MIITVSVVFPREGKVKLKGHSLYSDSKRREDEVERLPQLV